MLAASLVLLLYGRAILWPLARLAMYLNRTSLISRPYFGQDVSYYMFQLPFLSESYKAVIGLLVILLAATILLIAWVALSLGAWRQRASAMYRATALVLGVRAWGSPQADHLLYSTRGVVVGAGHTMCTPVCLFIAFCLFSLILMLALVTVRLRGRLTIILPAVLMLVAGSFTLA